MFPSSEVCAYKSPLLRTDDEFLCLLFIRLLKHVIFSRINFSVKWSEILILKHSQTIIFPPREKRLPYLHLTLLQLAFEHNFHGFHSLEQHQQQNRQNIAVHTKMSIHLDGMLFLIKIAFNSLTFQCAKKCTATK